MLLADAIASDLAVLAFEVASVAAVLIASDLAVEISLFTSSGAGDHEVALLPFSILTLDRLSVNTELSTRILKPTAKRFVSVKVTVTSDLPLVLEAPKVATGFLISPIYSMPPELVYPTNSERKLP